MSTPEADERRRRADAEYLASPDPERIWLGPKCEGLAYEGRSWCDEPRDCPEAGCDMKAVEYIRIDIAVAGGFKDQSR